MYGTDFKRRGSAYFEIRDREDGGYDIRLPPHYSAQALLGAAMKTLGEHIRKCEANSQMVLNYFHKYEDKIEI